MAKPRTQPTALPTLDEEIALLAARRDRVAAGNCEEAEALRSLATLSQVSGRLAALLQRAATTGAQELEQFFEQVALRAQGLAAAGHLPTLGQPADGATTDEQ